jgi:hypothetical protein
MPDWSTDQSGRPFKDLFSGVAVLTGGDEIFHDSKGSRIKEKS